MTTFDGLGVHLWHLGDEGPGRSACPLMTQSGSRGLAGPRGDECLFTGTTSSAGFAGPHVRSDVRLGHQGQP
jgi:hypothetical protein